MRQFLIGFSTVLVVATLALAAPVPKPPPKPVVGETNTNALVTKYGDKLKAEASTEWADWPVGHLLDGKPETSWYSNTPDNTVNGINPVVTLTFPEDVTIKRVTVLGNRDPQYPTGYFVTQGTIDLLDAKGKVVASHDLKGRGEKCDYDLILKRYTTVRGVRFTMTKTENGYCGMGEFQVE